MKIKKKFFFDSMFNSPEGDCHEIYVELTAHLYVIVFFLFCLDK